MKPEKILDAMELKLAELLGLYFRLPATTDEDDCRVTAALNTLHNFFDAARESLK